ncbi:MAG: hypothetical protein FWC21_03330 [Treponema sp.]|nr:hypothetical protein [Treponema sp.]
MKKLIWTGFAIFLALSISTCDQPKFEADDEILGNTNVVYSADGKSLTLYLDGVGVPQTRANRALTDNLAKMGYDYFEVVFFYRPAYGNATDNFVAANDKLSRASWEVGQSVGITGVYRTVDTGINYGTVTAIPVLTDGSQVGAAQLAISTAIIFVGRRSDKTLLAVGSITSVDNNGTGGPTFVTTATTNVTFSVAALTAGARVEEDIPVAVDIPAKYRAFFTTDDTASAPAGIASSFNTTTALSSGYGTVSNIAKATVIAGSPNADYTVGSTGVTQLKIGGIDFPLFELIAGESAIAASYEISTMNAAGFTPYALGIRLADIGNVAKREPRIPTGGGFYNYANFTIDQNTTVVLKNNEGTVTAVHAPFANPILFEFNTATTLKSIFSMTFDIPVYALVAGGETWFIRPGFGTYRFDLDDGKGGPGGAILLGTDMEGNDPIGIITRPW